MDLIDMLVTVIECLFIGLGMELGAIVAKVISVRLLNSDSPVAVHDADDEEAEEEEAGKKRRQRRARGSGGPSTSASVRAIM